MMPCAIASDESSDGTYVTWPWPVAIPESSSADVEKIANDLRDDLHLKVAVLRARKNPVCALWLEITEWKPNPGRDGYIVVLQPAGGVIMASNAAQLELAAQRLTTLARVKGDSVELPVGLLTNYSIIVGQ